MGLAKRVIPCLDVDAGRVVKGVQFVDIRDAGDPVEVARRYDQQGADEITFLDITASSDGRDTLVHVVEAVAAEVFIPLTVGGGILISGIAKEFFDRPRPDLVPHGSIVHTASFPSGHSMMAAVAYLSLGVLIARVQPRLVLKVYVMIVAVLLTIFVGVSRIYMGVHWPTDVAAGWLAGGAWAMICLMVARSLAKRGHIEREAKEDDP